MLNNDNRTTVK